jgi:uncharacterized UPF0160 family protein
MSTPASFDKWSLVDPVSLTGYRQKMDIREQLRRTLDKLSAEDIRSLTNAYFQPEQAGVENMELADQIKAEAALAGVEGEELEKLWEFAFDNSEALAESLKKAEHGLTDFEEKRREILDSGENGAEQQAQLSYLDEHPHAYGAGRSVIEDLDEQKLLPTATIATHDGTFHMDEVFAVAALQEHFREQGVKPEIIRTRDQEKLADADAVVDVGGIFDPQKLRFDHHQNRSAEKASCGLVAEYLERTQPEGKTWKALARVTQDIDAADLGKPGDRRLSEAVSNFNPAWNEDLASGEKRFHEALEVVSSALGESRRALASGQDPDQAFRKGLLEHPMTFRRGLEVKNARVQGEKAFCNAIDDTPKPEEGPIRRVKISNPAIPYQGMFSKEYMEAHPAEAKRLTHITHVEFPTSTGAFGAVATPSPDDPMRPKSPFPESWRGKRGQELIDAVNLTSTERAEIAPDKNPNDYFCHPAGFFLAGGDQRFVEVGVSQVIKMNDLSSSLDRLRGVTPETLGQAGKVQEQLDKNTAPSRELAKPAGTHTLQDIKRERSGKVTV